MRKFLTIIAGALALAGIGAAGASATNIEYGPGGGALHWPTITTYQSYRYSLNFIDGAGPGSDSRWLTTGTATGAPFVHAEAQTNYRTWWTHAPTVGNCQTGYTNVCVVEINDPSHLGCGVWTNNQYDACTYINLIDGLDHFYAGWIELNWYNMAGPPGPFPLRTRQYRQHTYQHEVGHMFGLAHRTAASCSAVMVPSVCSSNVNTPPIYFDSHDSSMLLSISNHSDGYSHGFSIAKPRVYVNRRVVIGTKQLHALELQAQHLESAHDSIVIRKDPDTPRVITEYSNGVFKIEKGGRTYWIGNKSLTRAELDWYVAEGVMAALIVR